MEEIEDTDYVASEHDRLINAVTKLDKTQHITAPSRSEPTISKSEFNLIKSKKKLNLSEVAKVLENTSHRVQIGKKLKHTEDKRAVLKKPLEKPQIERIKRSTGYDSTKEKVGRWDPVVARNRTVDQVVFPIKHETSKLVPTNEFLSKFTLKSPLERELEEVDPPPEQIEEEEEKLYPMNYNEMIEHRQNLARLRARQSYQAAKNKRQGKIKSKKYHRILKKEKLKQQLKEFEELQKTDPEEALKKLEALEKTRALERHTLRHRNTGKWAKNKMVRAKYDKDARQELAEQLTISKNLTHKTHKEVSSDSEADDNEVIPDITLAQDPMNPWMMKRSDKSNVDAEFDFGYKKYLKDKMYKKKEGSDTESDDDITEDSSKNIEDNNKATDDTLSSIKERINKMYEDTDESDDTYSENENGGEVDSSIQSDENIANNLKDKTSEIFKTYVGSENIITRSKSKRIKSQKIVATSEWTVETVNTSGYNSGSIEDTLEIENVSSKIKDIAESSDAVVDKNNITDAFENLEDELSRKVQSKLKKIRKNLESLERQSLYENNKKAYKDIDKPKKKVDNLEYLKLKNQKVKAIVDEELIETSSKEPKKAIETKEQLLNKAKLAKDTKGEKEKVAENRNENTTTDIDPNKFISVKPKYLHSIVPEGENGFDDLDDEQVVPKVDIEEVFEEDDVVDSFRQEKEEQKNKDTPQDVDLSLPGWGSWGGKGIKPTKRKNNRFILKAPPKMPRRDDNKGDIIIKEFKNPKLSVHKVTDVPFPFSSVKEYEASIRAPIGNTFIPETAHKKLTKPSVVTKAGAIIEPMDEDELLVKRNRNFKDDNIIKLLGQKR